MKFFYLSLYIPLSNVNNYDTLLRQLFLSYAMTPREVSSQTRGNEYAKHAVYSACCHNAEDIENRVLVILYILINN